MRTIQPLKFHRRPNRHRIHGCTAMCIHHSDNGVSYENSAIGICAISMICRDRQSIEDIGCQRSDDRICSHDIFVVRGTCSIHNIYGYLTIVISEAGQLHSVRRIQLQSGRNLDIDGGVTTVIADIRCRNRNLHILDSIFLGYCLSSVNVTSIVDSTTHIASTMCSGFHH